MNGGTPNFDVPPAGLRVFVGFRHPDLTQERFQRELGQTFMPGTPYMLQPLGLAAYLPAAVPEQEGVPCPHEVAVIAYRSPDDYRRIMNDTLRGRVYAQSHGGVYQRGRSRAAFPILLDPANDTAIAFFLWDRATDWQSGETSIHFGVKRDAAQTADAFRAAVRSEVAASSGAMAAAGIDQCIVALSEEFVVLWNHRAAPGAAFDLSAAVPSATAVYSSVMQRVICQEDPPTVTIAGPAAFNFIFLRDDRWFIG
ncbi:MAG: hypothetical protein K2Y27_29270 [Xanthobacteraceae bacterium]|nr:hypothetical protein [Xanthobacteraceae bacterium]